MNRRQLLAAALSAAPTAGRSAPAQRTRWRVRASEGFDALCFLGPLSGKPFYARYYANELAAIASRLPQTAKTALSELHAEADAKGALLGPNLCTLMSGGPDATLEDLIAALDAAETALLPAYEASPYWRPRAWSDLIAWRPRLHTVLTGLVEADFAGLRRQHMAAAPQRIAALQDRLRGWDVIAEQERLLGRTLEPSIEIILLWFSKPHGIRIQGQRFLNHLDYPDDIQIRTAAHEILHPPVPMDGPAAQAALDVLRQDALIARIVAEHDPAFGYNSLEGLLNEDLVQALDQIIAERLGVSRPPARRWAEADGGMHVLAAGLYGLLKQEGYDRTGGNIARWLLAAARSGALAPAVLHPAAARVLETPIEKLWPRA